MILKALPIEDKFFRLGARYVNGGNADVRNLARALFLHHASVDTQMRPLIDTAKPAIS